MTKEMIARRRLAWLPILIATATGMLGLEARANVWVVPSDADVASELGTYFHQAKWVVLARVASLTPLCPEIPAALRSHCAIWDGELEVLEHFVSTVPQPDTLRFYHRLSSMGDGPPGEYAVGDTIVALLRPFDTKELGVVPIEWGWMPVLHGSRVSIYGRDDDLDRDSLLTLCRRWGRQASPEGQKARATFAVRAEALGPHFDPLQIRFRVREAWGLGPLPAPGSEITVTWSPTRDPVNEPAPEPELLPGDKVIAFLIRASGSDELLALDGGLSLWRIDGDRCVIQPRMHSLVQFEPRTDCYGEPADLLRSAPLVEVLSLVRSEWRAGPSEHAAPR